MFQNKRKILEFVGSMCLSAILFLVIYKFIPIVYSTNDDRMIAEIISGQYTGKPESYAIQMTYGFTWFVSKLYELARGFNWYGIVLIGVQIFSFGTVLYRLQSFAEKWISKGLLILAAMAAFVGIWVDVYVQFTYTTTAAFVGMAAIFWYAASKSHWKNILMFGILANIAFSIRPNVFYMFVPATGLVYLWKLIGKKDLKKLTIAGPFMVLAVTLCLFLINMAAYSKDGWKEFREFFDVRTNVYDYYDLLPYNEYPELYEPYGISEEEFNMLRVYNYTTMGELPKEFFPQYLEACKDMEKAQGIGFVSKSIDAVKVFVKDVFAGNYGVGNTVLFVSAAVILAVLLWKRQYALAFYHLIQCAAICVLWLYFTYWGRAIGRIQVTMSLILLAVLLHMVCEIHETKILCKYHTGGLKIAWGAMTIAMWVGAFNHFMDYRADNIAKTHWYNDVQTIKEYCAQNPERLYLMDVATMTELYGKFTIKNTEPEYMNYISLGDWSAYCPHFYEKLERHGVTDVASSITDENTYVIILNNYQVKCMNEYLGVEESWEETIFGANEAPYPVFQFHKK